MILNYTYHLVPTKKKDESSLFITVSGDIEAEKKLGEIKTANWDTKLKRVRIFDLSAAELKKYLKIKEEIVAIERNLDNYKKELSKTYKDATKQKIQEILSIKIQERSKHNEQVQEHIDKALKVIKQELNNIRSLIDKGATISDTQQHIIKELKSIN